MAHSATSTKLKRLRQRFGISAPRLAIRTHVAWYWRALMAIAMLSVSLAAAAWIYDEGMRIAGFHKDQSSREIQTLRDHVMELDAEVAKLRSLAGSGESSLQIERATQKQLYWQVKALEAENAALKEDLAFFEGLVPTSDLVDEGGVRIDHLRIEPDGVANEYRYRMLVVNNAGRQAKDLKGVLQFAVKVRWNDKDVMLTLPAGDEQNQQRYRFEIKHFHRLEGAFTVPEGAVVRSVEARLVQDGVIRSRQLVNL